MIMVETHNSGSETTTEGIVLERTERDFENQAVLNPSCIEKDGVIHMFYRAVHTGNFSTIGYCQLDQNNTLIYRRPDPLLTSEHPYESHGLEDPRIVFLDGTYYLFYTAYDGKNARIAYATSDDLIHFTKKGLLLPNILYKDAAKYLKGASLPEKYMWYADHYRELAGDTVLLWEKDSFIFPTRINGSIMLVHRVMPGIQILPFKNFSELTLDYWKKYLGHISDNVVLEPKFWFESRKIGGGCPPVEIPEGWLFIYHGVEDNKIGRIYHAGVALLDRHNPLKVLYRLPEPLFSPTYTWEKQGDVANVVFPTSALIRDGRLFIYYGAADTRIAMRSIPVDQLVAELKNHPVEHM